MVEPSDGAKMASSGANQPPVPPSIWTGLGEKPAESPEQRPAQELETGPDAPDRSNESGRTEVESSSAADTMGMSVALDGDARQAAAVKLGEEQALVRKAQAGDRLAFEDLVRRYDRDVLRLALNLVHRPEDARDVYQEGFLRAYRNLHRFRFECSFYTWLYRIVTNVALDHLRRRTSHREEQAPAPKETEGVAPDFFDRQPELRASANPEKSLLGHEVGQQIERAMKRLSPRERVVFEMKHYQGLRLRAIGDLLGTSEETVKNSLFRATRKLRESLDSIR
ncbi:MAG: sigma-70 family RNA polymerase sigma factor [Candidatus Acidiferrales bacterium]